jgi:hypothetical protein
MCTGKMAFSDPSLSAQFKLGLKLIERSGMSQLFMHIFYFSQNLKNILE